VRANNDTFHTTNCSPQVKGFNRSAESPGEWGKFENFVQAEGKVERYCIFAGPIFSDADEVFEGVDRHGKVQVKIPTRFWKMVVARLGTQLQAFAFVLEQDLSDVQFREAEFKVTAQWKKREVKIADLEAELTGIQFPKALKAADQKK
jgi:endonuclease G